MNIENLSINTIRFLCAEAIQESKSGHPGLPLGAAPTAFTLWAKQMKHNPKNPDWLNRDRFILSAGHGSTLLYSLFHLFGYGISIEDLKSFRQMGSLTPGHPEYGHTKGVEITTGPLGQGIANGVGMAMAEKHLAAVFNKPQFNIVDHYTYILCGDGCLMEGISHEAASLAGTLKLNKLIILYDSNNITIEGSTDIAFTENVLKRFESYGFETILVEDGNNIESINNAISMAKQSDKPSIIEVKTQIGYGSPNKQGKSSAHGEPLGEDELKKTKQNLNWDYEESFYVPDEVRKYIDDIVGDLEKYESDWNNLFDEYKNEYPELATQWEEWHNGDLPIDILNTPEFWDYDENIATRISSEIVLNKICKVVPNLFGGSADLAPSTKTTMKDKGEFSALTPEGANIHYGIREHAMTAIANAIAAYGGLRPYISGFFVFSDYMKPAMRLSALMKLPVINILTHDSIGVGEDGSTHQPIEQLAALRSIPNFTVVRPCDTKETAAAWHIALTNKTGPTALILSRQNLSSIKESGKEAIKGAYILKDSEKSVPDIILMATGSEVELIYKANSILKEEGIDARIVSMPSWEVFEKQTDEYKESILPKNVRKRIAVEALSSFGWERYVGLDGKTICISDFGASGQASELFNKYGFTVDNIVKQSMDLVKCD